MQDNYTAPTNKKSIALSEVFSVVSVQLPWQQNFLKLMWSVRECALTLKYKLYFSELSSTF